MDRRIVRTVQFEPAKRFFRAYYGSIAEANSYSRYSEAQSTVT